MQRNSCKHCSFFITLYRSRFCARWLLYKTFDNFWTKTPIFQYAFPTSRYQGNAVRVCHVIPCWLKEINMSIVAKRSTKNDISEWSYGFSSKRPHMMSSIYLMSLFDVIMTSKFVSACDIPSPLYIWHYNLVMNRTGPLRRLLTRAECRYLRLSYFDQSVRRRVGKQSKSWDGLLLNYKWGNLFWEWGEFKQLHAASTFFFVLPIT